jgi:hypothetical protein
MPDLTSQGASTGSDVYAPSMPPGMQIPNGPKDWYAYPLTFGAMAPAATLTQTIQIDAAADFFLDRLEQLTMVNGTTTAPSASTLWVPLVTIQISDGGSNRNLFQNPVLLGHICGNGPWPHMLRFPRWFNKNSTINVTLTSVDGTNTYSNIYLNFEGFKVYN